MGTSQLNSFSLWCDFIERDFLENEFKNILSNVRGATSNPAIFASSILNSPAYKAQISMLQSRNSKEVYEALAIADIRRAATLLKPLWEKNKDDGYISIEIDPLLSESVSKSIDEGKRLFETIGMPNVMIKVPATQAGYEVMSELYNRGIPINATLIFSPEQVRKCLQALNSNKTRVQIDMSKNVADLNPRAVISIFVSRFDRAIDPILKEIAPQYCGKLGILNAMQGYHIIEENKDRCIRALFASTGVKNDGEGSSLHKTYYVDELLFSHAINTAPLETIKEFIKNPSQSLKLPLEMEVILKNINKIEQSGINISELYIRLMKEGLEAFINSFENLLNSLS